MNEFFLTVQENAVFLLTCLGIFIALALIARIAEKLLKVSSRLNTARTVSYIAMFSAIAAVLMLIEIPLFFAPSFYEIDLSEIPILICTFYLGPVAGVAAEALKVLVKLVLKGTTTAFVGDFANFVVGCSFVLPASVIYHAKPGKRSALIGMAVGTIVLTCFGSFLNAVYMIPKFSQLFGLPIDAIVAMGSAVNGAINSVTTLVLFAVVPFNLLKGILVSFITFLLYKRISPILHKNDARKLQKKIQKEM